MNREILCRGKRIDNGEWAYGNYVNCTGPDCQPNETRHYIVGYPNAWYEIYTSTLGECTGLRDRKGKRIWDGDILLFTNTDNEQSLYDVRWDYHRWLVQMHGDYSAMPDDLDECFCRYAEVIGNIYDNPELLGGAE